MNTIEVAPFSLVGIEVRTTNADGQAASDIGALWQKFMAENILQKIPNRVSDDIYSLYTEYVSDHNEPYTTMLGCRVESLEDIPEGMVGKSFGGGTYFKSTVQGDITKGLVVNHWHKIWQMDLSREYTADFEIYGPNAKDPTDAAVDFFIAVK